MTLSIHIPPNLDFIMVAFLGTLIVVMILWVARQLIVGLTWLIGAADRALIDYGIRTGQLPPNHGVRNEVFMAILHHLESTYTADILTTPLARDLTDVVVRAIGLKSADGIKARGTLNTNGESNV